MDESKKSPTPLAVCEYRFARCSMNVALRELRLDGQVRIVTKKVFDVLAILLQNRHRVVAREELLNEVWHGRVVVDNVLARTIMLARVAIGDTSSAAPLIKTITRVGYRFVTDVEEFRLEESGRYEPHAESQDGGAPNRPRICFLPFTNQTDDVNLVWVELGLMSLVSRSLADQFQLEVASTGSVLSCLEGTRLKNRQERIARLRIATGVARVVDVTVSKSELSFVLTFRISSSDAPELEGNLQGPELTRLALQLAQEIGNLVCKKHPFVQSAESGDPFVNECFARGLEAIAKADWRLAQKILAVGYAIEPNNAALAIYYGYSLARCGDQSALRIAAEVAEHARQTGNIAFELQAAYVEGLTRLICGLDLKEAIACADKAVQFGQRTMPDEWFRLCLSLRTVLAFREEDHETAGKLAALGIAASMGSNDRLQLIPHLINRGVVEARSDMRASLLSNKEAVALSHQFGQIEFESIALTNQFHAEYRLGVLQDAISTASLFSQRAIAMQNVARRDSMSPIRMIELNFRLHRYGEAGHLIQTLSDYLWNLGTPASQAARLWCEAYQHAMSANIGEMLSIMTAASEMISSVRYYPELSMLVPELALLLAKTGRQVDANTKIDYLASFEQFGRDDEAKIPIGYSRALLARLDGDFEGCMRQLKALLQKSGCSFWREAIASDCAWLHFERGQIEEGARYLINAAEVKDCLPEQLLVMGLYHFMEGRVDQALASQREFETLVGADCNPDFLTLSTTYQMANAESSGYFPLQTMRLPSSYHRLFVATESDAGRARSR